MAAEPGGLFVTGMLRSGTTLVEKLLANHPDLSVLSQPFPRLFVAAKQAFLAARGEAEVPFPLEHRFCDSNYEQAELDRFLARRRWTSGELAAALHAQAGYSGARTELGDVGAAAAAVADRPLAGVLAGLWRRFAHRNDAGRVGGKEVMAEEFVPYLAAAGIPCVLVLRDPRDVIASLNLGRGSEWGGDPRPVLFDLRNWRRSAAYALGWEGDPMVHVLRYEDLLADPGGRLAALCRFLGVDPEPAPAIAAGPLADQAGTPWRGNSSFGIREGVDAGAAGAGRRTLPGEVAAYVEAACFPELAALGYTDGAPPADAAATLARFREPWPLHRDQPPPDYSRDPAHVAQERRRLELLAATNPSSDELQPYVLNRTVYRRLSAAYRGTEPAQLREGNSP